jgi:hypothetical protein
MTFRTIAVASSLVLFTSLPVVAQTRVDFDRHRDFSQFKTFEVRIGPIVGTDGRVDELNTLAENRIQQAVTAELTSRGLEPRDTGADLVIRVSSRDAERSELVRSGLNTYPMFYRRWGYGRYYGYWAPRYYYDDVWTRRYLQGSYTVDAIDRETGDLVYRAQVSDEVGKDLDKSVTKAMDQAFKKFPLKERGN